MAKYSASQKWPQNKDEPRVVAVGFVVKISERLQVEASPQAPTARPRAPSNFMGGRPESSLSHSAK